MAKPEKKDDKGEEVKPDSPQLVMARTYDKDATEETAVDVLKAQRDAINKTLRQSPGAGKPRIMVTTDDGREIGRTDYIKELAAAGMTRGAIAKKLGVVYQIVFAATKGVTVKSSAEAKAEAEANAPSDGQGVRSEEANTKEAEGSLLDEEEGDAD